MSVLFYEISLENGDGCQTEYLEGTAGARGNSEYLEGTAEEWEMVMCD
jgi:hypothetical protein